MSQTARRVARLSVALCLACGSKAPAVSTTTVGWTHSDGTSLRDEYGRQWLFHGVNARVQGLFDVTFTDGRQPVETIPDFTQDDINQMAADGFSLLRLPINWSGLEPMQGQFDSSYLARLIQVIGWAKAAGLYVLVDFHQDAYSKEIGEDGAPLWAIVPPPTMLLGGPLTDLTQRRESTQVLDAFNSFFVDASMLEESFIPAWTQVVSQFVNEPDVVGYEPMNEPVAFDEPDGNGEADLQAFYAKADTAFRALDSKHSLWLEPDSDRNLTLMALLLATPFPDSNVVYCPHMYPSLVTVPENTTAAWVSALTPTFDLIPQEAASYGATPFLGEWGVDPSDPTQFPYVQAIQQLLDERNLGDAFWLWREESQGNWGFFTLNSDGTWTVRTEGLQTVSVPYAMAVPGSLTSTSFDPSTSVLTVTFDAKGSEAAPLLYIPSSWYPSGAEVTLNSNSVNVGSGRTLVPWSGQAGRFTIVVSPR